MYVLRGDDAGAQAHDLPRLGVRGLQDHAHAGDGPDPSAGPPHPASHAMITVLILSLLWTTGWTLIALDLMEGA